MKFDFLKKLEDVEEGVKVTFYFTLLRTITLNLFGLFIPIIIYRRTSSIALVAEYLSLTYGLFLIVAIFLLLKLLDYLSVEKIFATALIFDVIKVFPAAFLPSSPFNIAISSFFSSISIVFYWLPRHLSFVGFSKSANMAQKVSLLNLLTTVLNVSLPIIASFFLVRTSFREYSLYFLAFIIPFTVYLVIKSGDKHRIRIKMRNPPKKLGLFLLEGIANFTNLFLRVYIYIYSKSIMVFGAVTALSALASSLASYFLSQYIDKHKEFSVASLGFLVRANAITITAAVPNAFVIGLANVIIKFFSTFADPPFYGFLYNFSKIEGLEQVVYREIALGISRGILFAMMFFVDPRVLLFVGAIITIIYSFAFYFVSSFYSRINEARYYE